MSSHFFHQSDPRYQASPVSYTHKKAAQQAPPKSQVVWLNRWPGLVWPWCVKVQEAAGNSDVLRSSLEQWSVSRLPKAATPATLLRGNAGIKSEVVQSPLTGALLKNRPTLMILMLSKNNILRYYEKNTMLMKCKCIFRKNVINFQKHLLPAAVNLAPGFLSISFFKAGWKLVSSSRITVPPVLFMSRRLRYLLRVRSTWQKPCSATYTSGQLQ